MRFYRRRLPHRDVPGFPVFLTWRLCGSLPSERVFPREDLTSGEAFLAYDRLLDEARSGPAYLRQPEIAQMIGEHFRLAETRGLGSVHAYVVMPNHVHLLVTPLAGLADFMRKIKGPTAYQANRILGFQGRPFWQPEYFDRTVRNDAEFENIVRYIEGNPVKAGLAARPEDFPWSSASLCMERGRA